VVALVRGVHGLNGAVRVEVLTDHPEDRFVRGALLSAEGTDTTLTIVAAEAIPDGPGWRLRFAEIPDRTAAERLRGAYLEAVAAPDEALPRGSYYWHEVIGASVRDVADHEIGTVHDVYRVGGAEVFVVRGEPYGEFDVPAVRAFVRIFAPKRGEIVVDIDALALEPRKPPGPPRPPRTQRLAKNRRGRAATADETTAGSGADVAADGTAADAALADGTATMQHESERAAPSEASRGPSPTAGHRGPEPAR
jgi:16S rRNA processing protein RimM